MNVTRGALTQPRAVSIRGTTSARLVCASEHSIVIGSRISALGNIFFPDMCATAQNLNGLRQIVAITTLGAKTSVPCAGISGHLAVY